MPSISSYLKLVRSQQKQLGEKGFWGLLKYYSRWSHSFQDKTDMHDLPWMTFSVTDFLMSSANKQMRVFEYGAGSSTLFWAKRVHEVVSVEHDAQWAQKIREELSHRHYNNVSLLFIPPVLRQGNEQPDIADPYGYATEDATYAPFSFQEYVQKIQEYPDAYFDFIVVDGRARPSCIAASIRKVKPGGFLVVDNSERKYYFERTLPMLPPHAWKRTDFWGPIPGAMHFSRTTVFKRLS